MGWFVGISTRTPTTSISFTASPSSPAPHTLAVRAALPCQRTPHALVAGHVLGRLPVTTTNNHEPDNPRRLHALAPLNPRRRRVSPSAGASTWVLRWGRSDSGS